jgi:hypothetical protein
MWKSKRKRKKEDQKIFDVSKQSHNERVHVEDGEGPVLLHAESDAGECYKTEARELQFDSQRCPFEEEVPHTLPIDIHLSLQ